jgi:hypothetical protein
MRRPPARRSHPSLDRSMSGVCEKRGRKARRGPVALECSPAAGPVADYPASARRLRSGGGPISATRGCIREARVGLAGRDRAGGRHGRPRPRGALSEHGRGRMADRTRANLPRRRVKHLPISRGRGNQRQNPRRAYISQPSASMRNGLERLSRAIVVSGPWPE